MQEYRVSLEFECCGCDQTVGVTVQCIDTGLNRGSAGAAKVTVPCPTCHEMNQVLFEADGKVCCVRPHAGYRAPTPSTN